MKRWLTSFSPRYVRSLTYILQSSEYNLADAVRWFRRVQDFRHVEIRKRLVLTAKAAAVIVFGCLLEGAILGTALWLILMSRPGELIIGLTLIVMMPIFVALGLGGVIALVNATLQPIVTRIVISRARRHLSKLPAVRIAIAGSYGKTSMREILRATLSAGRRVAAPGSSINTPLGVSRFIRTLTGQEEVVIFEIGEYRPGDVRQLGALIQPHYGFLTGANEAHLEKFRTIERAIDTILELSEFVPADHLYVNHDDERLHGRTLPGAVGYSRAGAGEWRVKNSQTGLSGTDMVLEKAEQSINVHSQLLGYHQLGPLAAAGHLADRLGLTGEQIQRGLSATTPFDHRLQPVTDAQGVTTIDDSYNGNPDGVRAVIEFLAGLTGRRRWYVTPGLVEMGDRTTAVHTEISAWLAKAGIEHVVLIRNSVTPAIEAGLKKQGYEGKIHWFTNGLEALKALPHLTVNGDIVLLQNDWPDQYA